MLKAKKFQSSVKAKKFQRRKKLIKADNTV